MMSASTMLRPTPSKELFLRNMHFNGTIGGAFQRSGIYKAKAAAHHRAAFRQALRGQLELIERRYTAKPVTSAAHVRNIEALCAWSAAHRSILNSGALNFGIGQKLLNLHLKGLWCFGLLPHEPPHLPVDRIIQERLRIRPIRSWTKIRKAEHYMEVIDAAHNIAQEHGLSLAELELQVYNGTFQLPGISKR